MKKSNLEIKVGIFVVMALGLLAVLAFKAGDFYLKPGYTVRFIFSRVSGIDTGSPVRLAGVHVGEIKAIHVVRNAEGQTQVEALARIAQGALIEEDAQVHINSLGLLGEKYLEIVPGTSGAKTLSEGGTLIGRVPMDFDKLTESGSRLIDKMEHAVDNINDLLGDPQLKSDVKGTFSNAYKVSNDVLSMTGDLKDAAKSARIVMTRVRDGEGSIGRLLKDDKIAKDLEAFVEDIKAHPWKLLKRG